MREPSSKVPERRSTTLPGRFRQLFRLTALANLIALGFPLILIFRSLRGRDWYLQTQGRALIGWWMRSACRLTGLRVETEGQPEAGPVLMVANHVSWLDVLAINAVSPGVFIAKLDVLAWPLLGRLAELSGTRFIRRADLGGLRELVENITRLLARGAQLVAFPEGTSTLGHDVKPFSSALFQAAINTGAAVQAVTLQYGHTGACDRRAAFIDDDEFLPHLLTLLARERTVVHATFAPTVGCTQAKRQRLADLTREQILTRLQRHGRGKSPWVCKAAGANHAARP